MPPVACLYVSPSGMRPPISDIQRHPPAAPRIPFDQTVMREARSLKALERYGIEAMPTSAFPIELLREDRTSATKALVAMASRHRNPPRNLPELAAFADSLERSVAERYEDEVRRMFRPSSSWTRGRDTRGRFTRKPYTDPGDVMPPNGIWGWDGNGPAIRQPDMFPCP